MPDDTITLPSLHTSDFLSAFGLDRTDVKDIRISHDDGSISIFLELNIREHRCPVCNSFTSKVKGYQIRKINHSVLNPTPCIIHYRARRYVCPICGKTFYEHNPFISGNSRVSVATVYNVLHDLKNPEITFSYVANRYHMSASSVSSLFDRHIKPHRRKLPECLCFDETYAFKSRDSDYVCVLLDYTDKKIVDILPSRRKRYLSDYFYKIPLKERKNVKYVSFDMWKTYRDISKVMFPNCVCIVDKFHVLQELSRRVRRVRIDVMNKNKKVRDELINKRKKLKKENALLSPQDQAELKLAMDNYYLLKKFDWLLFSNDSKISKPDEKKKLNRYFNRYLNLFDLYHMLIDIDPKLEEAVEIKDIIHLFYRNTEYKDAKKELEDIIVLCRSSKVSQLQDFADTLCEWKQEIIHSFLKIPSIDRKMNNALIENRNKSIKLLKHSSNGYTNWNRFRARVMYSLNDDVYFKM